MDLFFNYVCAAAQLFVLQNQSISWIIYIDYLRRGPIVCLTKPVNKLDYLH